VLIESEQLYVASISTNDLTIERGVNGTAATSHPDGADISIYRYPGSVVEAGLLQASRLWRQRGGDSISGGSTRGVSAELDPEVRRLLSPYRRLPVGLGV
jgi:hypothetical protein